VRAAVPPGRPGPAGPPGQGPVAAALGQVTAALGEVTATLGEVTATLGEWLGPALGEWLRAALGKALRAALGKAVRAALGDRVKAALRQRAGTALGECVRAALGQRLGTGLGEWRAALGQRLGPALRQGLGPPAPGQRVAQRRGSWLAQVVGRRRSARRWLKQTASTGTRRGVTGRRRLALGQRLRRRWLPPGRPLRVRALLSHADVS